MGIICFDFPQSGTGVSLHLNKELRTTKNKGAFIPDIVAIKNKIVLFFENKDRFLFNDFLKVQKLKQTTSYAISIKKLLSGYIFSNIYYGVGLAYTVRTEQKTSEQLDKIDFAIFSCPDNIIKVLFDPNLIFQNNIIELKHFT